MKHKNYITSYMVFVTLIILVLGLTACGGGGGGGGGTQTASDTDTTSPTVSSTSPANSATNVAVNTAITATFSETMDALTVTTATFGLNNGVTGTVTYTGTTATFTPSGNLAYSTTYTATITTGVKDAAGNAMASNYTWTFTTGTATANPAPYTDNGNFTITDKVTGLIWQKHDDGVAKTWTSAITYCDTLVLGGQTDWRVPSRIELISIVDYGVSSPSINTKYFPSTISSKYWSSTGFNDGTYAHYVDFSNGDWGGDDKTISNYVRCVRGRTQTQTAPADTTPPTVSSTSPANSATKVAVNTAITATFSETMNASTVTTATFGLNNGVTGMVTYTGTTATFTPSGSLAYSTTYTATITTGVKDSAGNAMASAYTWTFTTGTTGMPDTGQTTGYTTTFGEDNDYTINPPSYTDNANGTITDNVTGLIWQKQDDGVTKTWAAAITYCDTLVLGGQTDWRLPSRIELISIVDYGGYNPSINTTYFPGTISSDYWSSTAAAFYYFGAWVVDFSAGNTYNGSDNDKTYSKYARCVRGGR